MTEKEKKELIIEAMTELDGIENYLRQIWPDEKPAVTNIYDAEYGTWLSINNAMVHIGDLRQDLESLEIELIAP